MLQVLLRRLMLAASFLLALGGVALADTIELASQVVGLNVIALSNLPENEAQFQNDGRWLCTLAAEEISSAAGKVVSAGNWLVTSEVEHADLTFISFVATAEGGTSGSCLQTDGNIGIFRGENLLGLIYSNEEAKRSIGSIQVLESSRLRIWDGDYLPAPLADLQIVGRDLVIVRNVADRDSFCGGTSNVPNIFGLPIHLARKVLLAEGWQPNQEPAEEADGYYAEARKLLPELDTCSGTGFGFCRYEYSKEVTQNLIVITAGETLPLVNGFSVQCAVETQP